MPGPAELYRAFDGDPGRIVRFLAWLAEAYGLPERARVLDVGCGPGRLLEPLAALGWEVAGMEPHPDFLAHARARAPRARVEPGGFGEIGFTGELDLVIGVNGAFAHMVTPAEREDAARRVFRALAPGGVVFLDLPNFHWILSNFRPPSEQESTVRGRRATLRRRSEMDVHAATFTTYEEYAVDGLGTMEMTHVYGMASHPELAHHLARAGFVDARTFDGYDARTAGPLTGVRILLAARRPADPA